MSHQMVFPPPVGMVEPAEDGHARRIVAEDVVRVVIHVAADCLILVHALQADHRVALDLRYRTGALRHPELAGQPEMLFVRHLLVAEEDDLEFQQRRVDFVDDVLGEVVGQVDAAYRRAQRTRQRLRFKVLETGQFALRSKQV